MTGIRGRESGQEKESGLKAASTMGREDERMEDPPIFSGLFAIRFLVFFVLSSSSLQLCIFGNPLTFSFSLVEGIRLTRTRLISGILTKIP